MWRHPRTAAAGYDWTQPELYQHIARVCERGKLDMLFFADLNYISDTVTGSLAPAIRNATQAPEHDPIRCCSFMAAATTHIGLGATYSVSHQHPFHAARLVGDARSPDASGRAAWNVVTTLNHNQSANYGEEMKPTDERRPRAWEFMDVCRKLWASWDEDAVVMDRDAGIFADPAKVHRIDHEGRFFKSRGPLNVVRSPPQPGSGHPAGRHLGQGPRLRRALRRCGVRHPALHRRRQGAVRRHQARRGRGRPSAVGVQDAVRRAADHRRLARRGRGQAGRAQRAGADRGRASPSSPAISTSTCRPCRSTPSWRIRTEPKLQRARRHAYRTATGELRPCVRSRRTTARASACRRWWARPSTSPTSSEAYFDQVGGDGFMLSPIYPVPARSRNSSTWSCRNCSAAAASGGNMPAPHAARSPEPGSSDRGIHRPARPSSIEDPGFGGDGMRGLGYRLTDMLVIAACSLTFVAVVSPGATSPRARRSA